MSNIIKYMEKYGNKTFEQKEFNEIDNVIFSSLSYLDFDDIVHKNEKVSLQDAADLFFKMNSKKELKGKVLAISSAVKVLETMRKCKRFKNVFLYNYVYKSNEDEQFSAIFIDYTKNNTYVSFEGTDELISGWKEDFQMSYKFPLECHQDAIDYVNRNISIFSTKKYIFGGHSKGGNLALVAAMYASPLIRNKIKKIYSNDGPGLIKSQIESREYQKASKKLELIIPNYSVVGLLLRHTDDYKVILSNKSSIMAHNFLSWQIIEDEFIETKLSNFSKRLDKSITNWLDTYSYQQREDFVIKLFEVFKRANIKSLLDIKSQTVTSVMNIIKESKKLDKESKTMIMELIRFIILYTKEDAQSFFKVSDN